jgi:hypothetical protein
VNGLEEFSHILGVEGSSVRLAGLDALDGTPVVDIKPWTIEFGPRGEVSQPVWSTELMRGYWQQRLLGVLLSRHPCDRVHDAHFPGRPGHASDERHQKGEHHGIGNPADGDVHAP